VSASFSNGAFKGGLDNLEAADEVQRIAGAVLTGRGCIFSRRVVQ
jgi:hypothetical protein